LVDTDEVVGGRGRSIGDPGRFVSTMRLHQLFRAAPA
jgi:hypothetical protein